MLHHCHFFHSPVFSLSRCRRKLSFVSALMVQQRVWWCSSVSDGAACNIKDTFQLDSHQLTPCDLTNRQREYFANTEDRGQQWNVWLFFPTGKIFFGASVTIIWLLCTQTRDINEKGSVMSLSLTQLGMWMIFTT